jgi:hypothetical protein
LLRLKCADDFGRRTYFVTIVTEKRIQPFRGAGGQNSVKPVHRDEGTIGDVRPACAPTDIH